MFSSQQNSCWLSERRGSMSIALISELTAMNHGGLGATRRVCVRRHEKSRVLQRVLWMQPLFPEASLQGHDFQAQLFRYLRNSSLIKAAMSPLLLQSFFALFNSRADCQRPPVLAIEIYSTLRATQFSHDGVTNFGRQPVNFQQSLVKVFSLGFIGVVCHRNRLPSLDGETTAVVGGSRAYILGADTKLKPKRQNRDAPLPRQFPFPA